MNKTRKAEKPAADQPKEKSPKEETREEKIRILKEWGWLDESNEPGGFILPR